MRDLERFIGAAAAGPVRISFDFEAAVGAAYPEAEHGSRTRQTPKDWSQDSGIVLGPDSSPKQIAARFIKAIEMHRHWAREIRLASPS